MRAALLFAVAAIVVIAGAWWLSLLPGSVSAVIGDTTIETSTSIALLLLAILFLLIYATIRLIADLAGAPRHMRVRGSARRRSKGDAAVTRTLVALAAGDAAAARREADRSRHLLGDTPMTLLLAAHASKQAGREGEADAVFQQLAKRPDAAFLGLRGLVRQAITRQDWPAATELIQRAEAAHPGAPWLREERGRLALRTGQWGDALRLSTPGTKSALAIAASEAATDPTSARRLAKEAWDADPALSPAALAYAHQLREAGREKAAQDVLARTWRAAPQPDLAAYALAPISDPLALTKAVATFVRGAPNHPESHLLLARTSLDAGLSGEARRHAEAAHAAGMNQRRLWVLLADIAEAEGDSAQTQDALRHVATADPDPVWRCGACGTVHGAWQPVCSACGTAGEVKWVEPSRNIPRLEHRSPQHPADTQDVEGVP